MFCYLYSLKLDSSLEVLFNETTGKEYSQGIFHANLSCLVVEIGVMAHLVFLSILLVLLLKIVS